MIPPFCRRCSRRHASVRRAERIITDISASEDDKNDKASLWRVAYNASRLRSRLQFITIQRTFHMAYTYAHLCTSIMYKYIPMSKCFYAERVMTEMAQAVVIATLVCAWKIFDAVATLAAAERKQSRKLIPAARNV